MQARATFSGAQDSKTFVVMALVLVAMGLAAMGGYVANSTFGTSATSVSGGVIGHPAAGSVLRQDNPVQASAELPGWLQREIAPQQSAPIIVDDPNYYRQFLSAPERSTGHKQLP
jgi:hypothetical protein